MMIHAWAAERQGAGLTRVERPVPELLPHQALIEVVASGICHSDIHLIDNDWKFSEYPLVPGHEIVGRVVKYGSAVKNLHVGTMVGIGWQHSSCFECEDCVSGNENVCDKNEATCVGNWGGYADYHIADARFCFPMPLGAQKPEFAPLLCGGATVFSPLHRFIEQERKRDSHIGIVALGGLGHMAVKFAHALGSEVTLFSSNKSKEAEAKAMGVDHYVSSVDEEEIKSVGRKLDLVLVTANVDLPWGAYTETLRRDGTLCFVGIPPSEMKMPVTNLLNKRLRIAASPIGSRTEIAQMLDFAARHDLGATIEKFSMDDVNTALDRVRKNQVRYRAVLVR